jgi:release factor glutamine methyltransferase
VTTIGEALREGRALLAEAGVAEGARDARLLLAAASGLDTAKLVADDLALLPEPARAVYDAYLDRRAEGEPVARILGVAEFWSLPFRVGPATLAPRADTETLVEAALEEARRFPETLTIADLGTGSGAIVVALLSELPQATAVATDISEEALAIARENAAANGVAGRVRFELADFRKGPEGTFNLVVSNPPYVRSGDVDALEREVRDYDPHVALDGGSDGLDAYRAILSRAGSLVAEDGTILFEVGYDQADSVARLCREAGLGEVRFRRDLGGVERVVIASETMSESNSEMAKKALGKLP